MFDVRGVFLVCVLTFSAAKTSPQTDGPDEGLFPKAEVKPSCHGEAVFLTPYIRNKQYSRGKALSRVECLDNVDGVTLDSYAAFLTVNETTDSNLFFWFIPSLDGNKDAPTMLWLQGGPGGSSMFGLFVEHGPLEVTKKGKARFRKSTWAKKFNMLYIDQPVGSGFSFTRRDEGYPRDEHKVGQDVFEALQQFFELFSEYSKNDFYVVGESYAGKYVPAVAMTIHDNKESAKMKLKGIAIGDGLCDPVSMQQYADFFVQIGLLDQKQAVYFYEQQNQTIEYIKNGDYLGAFSTFDRLILGATSTKTTSHFTNVTGINFHYNFLMAEQPADFDYYIDFIQTPTVRAALHVGNATFSPTSIPAQEHLREDFMKSMKPVIEKLMDEYKVLIYNGQLDIIIAWPLTASFVNSMKWSGTGELAATNRLIWRNPQTGDPAGYVRRVRNFTEVMVRNAGHILPYDQPENAFDMIDRFINNKPFN